MNDFSNLIPFILENKLNQAKDILNERLYSKMGVMLEEELEEYAPTVFMTEEEKEIYIAEKKKAKMKKEKDDGKEIDYKDEDEDGDIDEDGDTDKSDEYLKKRSEAISNNEAFDSDDEAITEEFLNELTKIVEELEIELGSELTEDEIAEIAEELLNESDENYDDSDDSDDDSEEEICENCE